MAAAVWVFIAQTNLAAAAPPPVNMGNGQTENSSNFIRGKKYFELTNHLGNVLATVGDHKTGVVSNGCITHYTAVVTSVTDYYPFGMQMPSRNFSSEQYRYGFNGKENDGETQTQDYGFRIYNPALGNFLSIDPLTRTYPMLTPYQFASNTPIQAIDVEGLEAAVVTYRFQTQKDAQVKVLNASAIIDYAKPASQTYYIDIDRARYEANSAQTLAGRDDKRNFVGDFSKVASLTSDDLAGVLGYGDFIFQEYGQKNLFKEMTVSQESNAGPLKAPHDNLLDFKDVLYKAFDISRDALINIDGIAYNANEAGNYVWAMILTVQGIAMDAKAIAELGTKGRRDELNEQKAIQAGIDKANSFLKNGLNLKQRNKSFELYRDDFYHHLGEGGHRGGFTPSNNLGLMKEYNERSYERP